MEIGVRSNSPWVLSTMYDRTRCPARGIQGGSPGAAGAVHTILSLPGSGGFGLATERDPDRVARDVRVSFRSNVPAKSTGSP
jgi:N-methylhydantoinase B/oxoprolinase/acetone carboxylase alpha subunit